MNDIIHLFLFMDALGWHTIQDFNYLADLLPERRPIEMQFGYSCTAIPTILTGKRPAEHGHLGFFRYAPDESPFKKLAFLDKVLVPKSLWNRGRVRHRLSQVVKWLYGYTGYFQLYGVPFAKLAKLDYAEKQDMFIRHGMGTISNLCDALEDSGISYHISDWHLPDQQNLDIGYRKITEGCRFLFLYTANFDALMHDHVGQFEAIRPKLDWYRKHIEALFQACKAAGKDVHFTIFSDHGMTPLTKTCDVMAAIASTGLRFGTDYGAVYDSTMVRFTYLTPPAQSAIVKAMETFAQDGHWLTQAEETYHGIYRADRLFGDAIFLMNPGIQIVPSDMGNSPLHGMHGFVPDDRYSQAAILSNQPIPSRIQRVSDYFSLMMDAIHDLRG